MFLRGIRGAGNGDYLVSGLLLRNGQGFVLGRLRLERYLSPWVRALQASSDSRPPPGRRTGLLLERLPQILRDAWSIVRGGAPLCVDRNRVGAALHGYVPEGFFRTLHGPENWYAVPLAVICAVPMYANAAGIVPVVQVFVAKGIPLGTPSPS